MTLYHSASQILTLSGGPRRGHNMHNLAIVQDGAILVIDDKIIDVGPTEAMQLKYPQESPVDLHQKVVLPGFVDPHTHVIWAGDRAMEFEMRLAGKTYMEIMNAGGGIVSTVQATRQASFEELAKQTEERLKRIFMNGTTTIEAKTGYGLDLETEIKQLQVLLHLDQKLPIDIVITFMGAHACPPEFTKNGQPDYAGYTKYQVETVLPAIHKWWQTNAPLHPLPFVDVFCEQGAFTLEQSRAILTKAKQLGFPLKIHVDEFENLGGASLAAQLNATSADHMVKTGQQDILTLAQSETVAVGLPGTPFGLAQSEYTPAKALIQANAYLALATDCNPGTSWCEDMAFIIALACRQMKMTPPQAITAATINAAKALAQDDLVGSIEPGKQADFLILNTSDYRNIGYRFASPLISHVVKAGKLYPTGH